MNTFYFDETDAFGVGITTPEAGDYITIPNNTTIKVTQYNISTNSYSGLTIPSTSRLIFVENNISLYLDQSPIINGEIVSAENSEIVVSAISGELEYSFWHESTSWNGGSIPQEGDNITIPDNTIMIIDNNSNISFKAYNSLTIPSSSAFIININYYTLYVNNVTLSGTIKLGEGSSIENISDYEIYNDPLNTNSQLEYYFDNNDAWATDIVPGQGDNIIVQNETNIIMDSSNIIQQPYNNLYIPETSTVTSEGGNVNLFLSNPPDIRGELIFKNNSKIVVNDLSETEMTVKYWNDPTIWNDNIIPVSGQNVIVADNIYLIVDNEAQIDGNVFETITIPSTSILFFNIANYTVKTYALTINGILKLGSNSGIRKAYSFVPRQNILFPGYKTYYFDDIDAWDSSGVPQGGNDLIVPDNTLLKITKRTISTEGYDRIVVPVSSKLIFVGNDITLMGNRINIKGEVKTTSGSKILTSLSRSTTNIFTLWDDPTGWASSVPPKAGEVINIPNNTHIVVTMNSSISINGYSKLNIPATSSLTFDIEYFKFWVGSIDILGSLALGSENRLIINPYYENIRTFTPLYISADGIKTTQNYSTSNIQPLYNFVMTASYTKARDFARYIKYKIVKNKPYFIYESKRVSVLLTNLRNDIINTNIVHNEGQFVSTNPTTTSNLSNMFIQYVCDILVNNPSSQSVLTNTISIRNQINNSNLSEQIINILKQGITTIDFLDNNTYLKSLFSQIQNERPRRLWNRKEGEVYHFPIYGGDDLSIFARMSSNINVSTSSNYSLLKSLYGTNALLQFNDYNQTVKIIETIWRININLI